MTKKYDKNVSILKEAYIYYPMNYRYTNVTVQELLYTF